METKRLRAAVTELRDVPKQLDKFSVHSESINLSGRAGRQVTASSQEAREFHPPEHVFGNPVAPSCLAGISKQAITVPPFKLYKLDQARIIGWSAALDGDNVLYWPDKVVSDNDLQSAIKKNAADYDGFVIENVAGIPKAVFIGREEPRVASKSAFFLPFLEPGNYGSFLFRGLPKLLYAAEQLEPVDCYIVPERTSWLREALTLCGLPTRPIYTVKEVSGDFHKTLYIVSGGEAEGMVDLASTSRLRSLAGRVDSQSGRPNEPIYVSRQLNAIGKPAYRPLKNEFEVERLVAAHGFRIVYPEAHSFSEQISIFSRATAIIGPSGSGMLNAIFSREGVPVLDMESFTYTVRQHAKIYSASGKRYSFLFGSIDEDDERDLLLRPWSVSLATFHEAMDWLRAVRSM